MTVRSILTRTSQLGNALLALSLLLALVHFRWSLELFAAGLGAHAAVALMAAPRPAPQETPAESLA